MDLMWCTSEFCKDVVRERVVGDHNQIVLNGPATGQVAYQWDRRAKSEERHGMKLPTTASVLLLVKPSDELYTVVANAVKQLTELEIEVLLVPELAAKLKHYHGVDDGRISLFDPPPEDGLRRSKRISMENEGVWFGDSFEDGLTPFPDLVCTLGGDGLLMHASMMFQGACPPMLSIAGGSLGFLTPFSQHEMVDAIRIALGLVHGQRSKGTSDLNGLPSNSSSSQNYNRELEVFPPNMPSYPYEPLVKAPHARDSTPKFSFGFGESICLSIRMRLDCRIVSREGAVKARYNVLNEVVIDRGSSPYLAALECFCDDVHLTTVQADGVIIAT
jgi:NAD kinase